MRLLDRRVLVVGASSGLGRASALAIAAEGANVMLAARRVERLDEVRAEAGKRASRVACDVRDENSCRTAVAAAVEAFGGLDAVVYSPGTSPFAPIEDIDAETWRSTLDTNLVGAASIARFAVPHLEASGGKAIFFSSIVIDDRPPRPYQAPYVVSKVALETLVQAWQGEHRGVGFTTIAMGDTITEFGIGADPEVIAGYAQPWAERGYMYGRTMEPESVAEQVVNALSSSETVRRIALTPHYPDPSEGNPDVFDLAELDRKRREAK